MNENKEIEEMNEIYFKAIENIKHGGLDKIILEMWDAQIEGNKFKFEEARKKAERKISEMHNHLYAIEDMVQNSTWEVE